MANHKDYTFSKEQVAQVGEAMKSPIARVAQRATVLHGLHLGYRVEEVAQMHNLSTASIYNHMRRFEAEGQRAWRIN
jgi:transposase